MSLLRRAGRTRWQLCACAGLLLTLAPLVSGQSEAEQRARLQALKSSIETLRQELQSVKSNRSDLQTELERSEKAIGDLSKQVEQLKQQLESNDKHLKQLEERQSELEKDKSAQQDHVQGHLLAAYRLGQQSNLQLLLNQQDPALVARNLKYFDYITRARVEKITGFLATLTELRTLSQEIESTSARLQRDHETLRLRRRDMDQQQAQRRSTLRKLEATIANKDEELQQLEKDEAHLQRLLRELASMLADIDLPANTGAFTHQKGKLPWPLQGKVMQRFGSERVAGRIKWQGLLIAAAPGTPVKSVHHGRVVFSDYLRGHGLLLIVDHGDGYMSLYAHNQALFKEIGEWVEAGEVIASVGSSGGQSQAALYFELRHQGRPTDPHLWIKAT